MVDLVLAEELVGRGLILRRPRWPDVDEVVAICREPDIPMFTRVPPDYQRDDFEKFLVTTANTFSQRRGGAYLIREDIGGPVLGSAGVTAKDGYAEAGYYLAGGARGKGVATRALKLICDQVFAQGQTRITLEVRLENDASLRVGERSGFRIFDTVLAAPAGGCGVEEKNVDLVLMERLAPKSSAG